MTLCQIPNSKERQKSPRPLVSFCQIDFFKRIRQLIMSTFHALSMYPEENSAHISQNAFVNPQNQTRISLAFPLSAPALQGTSVERSRDYWCNVYA